MSTLRMSVGTDLPRDRSKNLALMQVGWLGASGAVYALDDQPFGREPGSWTPLYIATGVWEYLGDGHYAVKD